MPRMNLGHALASEGRLAEAIAQYPDRLEDRAIARRPDERAGVVARRERRARGAAGAVRPSPPARAKRSQHPVGLRGRGRPLANAGRRPSQSRFAALPEIHRRVRPPGTPRFGARDQGRRARRARGTAQPQVRRGKRVGIAARPHQDVLHRPVADTGQRAERRIEVRSREGQRVVRDRPGSACRVARRRVGTPSVERSAAARSAGRGKTMGQARRSGRGTARPHNDTSRPASVEAPLTVTCCPRIARIPSSNGSHAPGTRRPGQPPDPRRQHPIGRRDARAMTRGSGVEIEHAADPVGHLRQRRRASGSHARRLTASRRASWRTSMCPHWPSISMVRR